MKLISVKNAQQIILKNIQKSRLIDSPLSNCVGKILVEDVHADCDQPSADRSSMDGIAIAFNTWQKNCREFQIRGVQKAGIPAKKLIKQRDCFEIMTGAVIPTGCDCVVPIEHVETFGRQALINSAANVERFQFIRKQGSEYKKNKILLNKGTYLNVTHISVAASVGKNKLKVFSPKIAVIGTGDELVEINKPIAPHQARRSNAYALESIFHTHGFCDVKKFHINDNLKQLRKALKQILVDYDVLVLSGGVSMGKFDFIPQVLNELGVKVLFHKVSQKPGKPFWFGVSKTAKKVFALPGNPVSTLVCAARYVVPYLRKSGGIKAITEMHILAKSVKQNPNLTLFIPVTLKSDFTALPVALAGSGDYGALTASDGFIEIPPGNRLIVKGERVQFFKW